MRRETSEWSIRMLADFEGRINVEAEYQRGEVWSQPQQALLIDSILRGFDLPKIFLRKLPDGSPYLFDVIDGKQRLTAIWRYVSDEFALLRTAVFSDLGNLGGRRWSELPDDARDRLQFANVTVSKIEAASDEEIRELFLRLQRGEPLNAAERRNAMSGPVRDFVADRLAAHPVWRETGLRVARFGLHEYSAIALALVLKGGATGLKGADLTKLYENDDFNPEGEVAHRTIRILDSLQRVAATKRGFIRTRWGLVDLLLVLMRLEDERTTLEPSRLMTFFERFEEERRSVAAELSDLRTSVVDLAADELPVDELEFPQVPPEMLSYDRAFTREGASEENVKTRSAVMYQRLLAFLQET